MMPTKMKKSPSRIDSDLRTIFEDATAIVDVFLWSLVDDDEEFVFYSSAFLLVTFYSHTNGSHGSFI